MLRLLAASLVALGLGGVAQDAGAALATETAVRPVGSPLVAAGVERVLARDGSAQVVVLLRRSGRPAAVRARVLDRAGGEIRTLARWDAVPAVPALVTASGLARLARDPEVRAIGLDGPGGGAAGRESLPLIRADGAHAAGHTGSGVTVAVLDSGIARAHADLAPALVGERCFTPPRGCPNGTGDQSGAGSAQDDNGHGTNVAGIVASRGTAAPRGVASASRVVAVKVLDRNSRFESTSQIISALDWIAVNRPDVKVVNMSLGTDVLLSGTCDEVAPWTRALASAVAALRARGVTLFASSMNNAATGKMAAPACLRDVVAVGAVYDSAFGPFRSGPCADSVTATDKVACFSNSGAALDLLAPGAPITSTGLGSPTSTYAGTSQASAVAAGTAAVLVGAQPSLAAAQVEARLKETGKRVFDARNGVVAPRVDALAAVGGAAPLPPDRVCVVPRVLGKLLAAARSTILRGGCAVGRVTSAGSRAKRGVVIAQTPRAGARLALGAQVRLVLSSGRRAR